MFDIFMSPLINKSIIGSEEKVLIVGGDLIDTSEAQLIQEVAVLGIAAAVLRITLKVSLFGLTEVSH